MDANLLADARSSYAEHGYFLIRGALQPAEIDHYAGQITDVYREATENGVPDKQLLEGAHSIRVRNIIGRRMSLGALVDHPGFFPVLLDLMGPYLRLVGSEGFVRDAAEAPMVRFHTDGGPSMQMTTVDHTARALQTKVQIFLTDVDEPDHGNFMFIPGSHRRRPSRTEYGCFIPEANENLESGTLPEGAVQLHAKAGDAVVFPYSLWHAVAPNRHGRTRRSIILRYGQMWHQPFDFVPSNPLDYRQLTRRQRRILGEVDDNDFNPWYKPANQVEIMTADAERAMA